MNNVVFSPARRGAAGRSVAACAVMLWVLVGGAGCPSPDRDDLDYSYDVEQFVVLPELDEIDGQPLVQFESVFWEPDDTTSLRKLIVEDQIAAGRNVLEIGTGTGLLSLLCLSNGAQTVVATDINPAAVANARYNVAMHQSDAQFQVRQVAPSEPGAFAVIKPEERFDLILSNPPWEDGKVAAPADHAFYDPDFALMDSLLDGLPKHLTPGGRCLLAYGHAPAITRLLSEAKARGYQTKVLDDRDVEKLPRDFLPGMLIEVRLGRNQIPKVNASSGDPPATDLR
ncbi:50S ribosomal protein L11 methyltransferase [Rhodopirellula sp. JC639]|uniref:50S ribosomal protein L11 methyltransferase n=1 Tax=Stieleria mannarensis TaxID=2755585 RepID=UPI0016036B44|nr:class I SAM-dependent methyltransferase [Rhodopirellula sp. JC639]